MKKTISFLLLISSLSVEATYNCEAGDDPQLMSCGPAEEPIPKANGCDVEAKNPSNSNLEKMTQELSAQACEEQDVWKGMTAEEKEQKLKEMNKLCKKEAKAYKKSVFKSLLKKGKFGQALQVVFKRKKNIIDGSGLDKSIGKDIAGMNEEQLRSFLQAEISKLHPQSVAKGKTTRTYHSKTIPFNMVINNGKGASCSVKASDFPSEPAYEKPECVGCEHIEIMSSFTNDCSYMVSGLITEKVVFDEILDKDLKDKKQYCQSNNMDQLNDKSNNKFGAINGLAAKLCKQIQDGEEPRVIVETTRNLYADKTPQLAFKRGTFVKKYISWHLKKNCDLKGAKYGPGFDSIVDVKLPAYGEKPKDGKELENFPGWRSGDYGPNPEVTGEEEIKREKDLFAKNLEREEAELKAEVEQLKKDIAEANKQIAEMDAKTPKLKKNYNSAKDQLEEMKKYQQELVDASENLLTSIGNEAMSSYAEKQRYMKKRDILEEKLVIDQKRLSDFSTKSKEKMALLDEFYQAGPARNKKEWDEKLFNSFKMARISVVHTQDEDDVDLAPFEKFSPEIATLMKELMALQTFTCNLSPIETKRTTLEGVLKFPLKVASILTLPVLAVGGAAVTVGLAPINTAIGAFCRGCNEPGGTLPRFFAIGDVTQLDLSKSSRRGAWDATKGFIKNYVTWGGALNVNGQKHITKHHLDQFHPNWDKLDPKAQEDVIDDYFKKEFPVVTSTPNGACHSGTVIGEHNGDATKDKPSTRGVKGNQQ